MMLQRSNLLPMLHCTTKTEAPFRRNRAPARIVGTMDMNAFEEMGHSLILAQEGQRQLAALVSAWIADASKRLAKSVGNALAKVGPSVGGA
jgi:hypothetical protein